MSRVKEVRCRTVGFTGEQGEWRETVADFLLQSWGWDLEEQER